MKPWLRFTLGFWLVVALIVWNGFFDILVTRGEKQYLLGQARHELGIGPAVSIDGVMTPTIHDAARKASVWGVLVFVAGVGSAIHVRRLSARNGA